MCQWVPASSPTSLRALQEEDDPRRSASSVSSETAARPPLRIISDPYPSFSSVAVDLERDEVVMTDENLFQILVYDRLTNTPPTARMTEPKRMIGGTQTKIEFQCGVYVDPKSGDIYAINNDTVDTMVIFSREARGNVPPDRELRTPHGTFGIAVHEQRQELFLTIQHTSSVVVYPKAAVNEDPPLRVLHGSRTGLADPHGIALDTRNNVFFVSNHGSYKEFINKEITEQGKTTVIPQRRHVLGSGRNLPPSITVHALDAKGDEPPVRVIGGPKTQLNWPSGMAADPERDELYVANDSGNAVLVFRASASGDVAPLRVIQGPRSGIQNPTGLFLDTKNDELWVSNFGNHTVTVYKPTASGDAPPLRTIRSGPRDEPALMIGNPGGLAYDTKRDEILVPN
jgi:DNA-binding beta-propeller fold protein YncE